MRFDYYRRLSRDDRKTYRDSDAIADVRLPEPERFRPLTARIEGALRQEDRARVQRASQRLATAICRGLGTDPVRVRVLAKRPKSRGGELHGLYTSGEDETARIEVWMRTAEHRRVVAFRTFLRTLIHELCHHLDLAHFDLEETFHTEGFFRRESSLFRQVAPPRADAAPPKPAGSSSSAGRRRRGDGRQLELFR